MNVFAKSPEYRVPIQFRPGTHLYTLRMDYGDNPHRHIIMLEQTVLKLERELDALHYRDERRERVLSRLKLNVEELK